jgi:hypothetical protein
LLQKAFRPLLHPLDQSDAVTLLVRADDVRRQPGEFRGGKVVTAAPDNFVYLLGRFLLAESGIISKDLDYHFSGHEIKALQTLLKGGADLLFMLSETYRGLSGLTRDEIGMLTMLFNRYSSNNGAFLLQAQYA